MEDNFLVAPYFPLVEVSYPVLLGETHSDQEGSITLNYLDTADNNALATAVFPPWIRG